MAKTKAKTMRLRLAVPVRPGFNGIWLPGVHLTPGMHDVELPIEFEQAPGLAPGSMLEAIEAQKQQGLTIVAVGDDLDLLPPLTPEAPKDGPEHMPPPPPNPGEPGSPGRPLKPKEQS